MDLLTHEEITLLANAGFTDLRDFRSRELIDLVRRFSESLNQSPCPRISIHLSSPKFIPSPSDPIFTTLPSSPRFNLPASSKASQNHSPQKSKFPHDHPIIKLPPPIKDSFSFDDRIQHNLSFYQRELISINQEDGIDPTVIQNEANSLYQSISAEINSEINFQIQWKIINLIF
jgi:hypothetical protein